MSGKNKYIISVLVLFLSLTPYVQASANREGWIVVPETDATGYGVYVFRHEVTLSDCDNNMRIWVSGDNRYKLFVNGQIASIGPARSDLPHWNCEEVNLAPYLHNGKNILVAIVWNEGTDRTLANMTYRTGFFIRAVDSAASVFNTDERWQCLQDKSYSPVQVKVKGYYAAGPGERIDMHYRKYNSVADLFSSYNSNWSNAEIISTPYYVGQSGQSGTYLGWLLKKSDLPQRELKLARLASIREAVNVKVNDKFLQGSSPLTIPANTNAKIIIDNKVETNAYLTLNFKGGDNSKITIGYTEAFYNPATINSATPTKGNRNEVKGKVFVGRTDTIISNGNDHQEVTTLAWRTYRYVVLAVNTADEPITINDIYGTYTGFPFELKAKLDTDDDGLQQIFNVGWRSAQLCAIETYMDCPYYEQLQYFGDARIQALVSLYMTGDDRLVKQLLDAADWSRGADGVTQSRYPSQLPQWIQPYALHYIYTLHDYMMYGNDTTFLKSKLIVERTILDYFHKYQTADGRLKNLPGWNFTDWVEISRFRNAWQHGVAIPGTDGCNAVMDLQLLYAYEMAADLESKLGMKSYVDLYHQRIAQLKATIMKKYWKADKGLFSDRSDRDVFSQHANALAILSDAWIAPTPAPWKNVGEKIETDSTLAPATIYFKFYTHQAMTKAGLGNDYCSWLGIWYKYLDLGLTTCGEMSDVDATRSDCHAWGASPNIEFFRTILGIESDAPCFSHVLITPYLANIKKIGGTMPTPYGNITVQYHVKGKLCKAKIILPEHQSGTFKWKDKEMSLHSGENSFVID